MTANELASEPQVVERPLFDLVYRALPGAGDDSSDRESHWHRDGEGDGAAPGAPSLSFPCDALGRVDLDALGELDMADYLLARTLVGRRFHRAVITPRR